MSMGREVVVSKKQIEGTNGRAFVFHTAFDPTAPPISPELEAAILGHTESDTMRKILAEGIAATKGTKPTSRERA
ncbi:hypothetical protein A2Z00_03335 [Candidatus Gottesmanbacteria bacterium RBG_13_45_10]|uniref:Uncharacterized protein n=1 Tax=Candidatus Gottesmanbacteria bacterium RBG_13_45_10 TaxID=1798370 RepID=A0A1F5ZI71_9BACT|nr:MAG: hypothetical protein A2Z00_03335 [Candidatus Gottesmanbacteria bacterium RBG_13_45_10]